MGKASSIINNALKASAAALLGTTAIGMSIGIIGAVKYGPGLVNDIQNTCQIIGRAACGVGDVANNVNGIVGGNNEQNNDESDKPGLIMQGIKYAACAYFGLQPKSSN